MADEALLAQGLCMRTLVIGYCALLDACDVVLGLLSAERTQRARGQMAGPSPASSKLSQCGLFVNILIQPFDQFRHNASGRRRQLGARSGNRVLQKPWHFRLSVAQRRFVCQSCAHGSMAATTACNAGDVSWNSSPAIRLSGSTKGMTRRARPLGSGRPRYVLSIAMAAWRRVVVALTRRVGMGSPSVGCAITHKCVQVVARLIQYYRTDDAPTRAARHMAAALMCPGAHSRISNHTDLFEPAIRGLGSQEQVCGCGLRMQEHS